MMTRNASFNKTHSMALFGIGDRMKNIPTKTSGSFQDSYLRTLNPGKKLSEPAVYRKTFTVENTRKIKKVRMKVYTEEKPKEQS